MKLSERPGLLGPLHHTTIYTIINPELLNPELQNQVDYRYLNIVMGKETSGAAWYARPVTPGRRPVKKKRMFHIIPNRSPNLQRWKTIYNNPSLASCILTNCLQQLLHSTIIPSLHFVHLPKIWNSTISKKAKATNLTGKLICSLNRSLQKLRHW